MSPAIIVLFVNILFLVKIMWVSRPLFPSSFPRVALSTWRQQTKRTRPTARTRPAPRASQTADRSAVSLRFSADWFRVIVRRKNSINDQIRQRKTCETWSNRRQQKKRFQLHPIACALLGLLVAKATGFQRCRIKVYTAQQGPSRVLNDESVSLLLLLSACSSTYYVCIEHLASSAARLF